ncbi:SET and MYND domain-containing protein 4-like [Orussus abietinus]|uniref:SET and MYND domain-containing protein 4-like n=1 Tax=Orussus abietinus TaxID=222816 RepID=UPI0006260034|nr:SET and MYND domain-containing protein 4-like [Orussus abietinus]
MENVLNILNRKLYEVNRHPEFNAKFKMLSTDEQRVIFTFNLLEEFGIKPESTCEKKNAATSVNIRVKGNELFTADPASSSRYVTAWKMYSESIARAPPRSKELALAYANRSAVLFRFKKYKECLEDIDRALSLDYPDDLKPKLLLRKGTCLKALGKPEYEKTFEEAHQLIKKMSVTENIKTVPKSTVQMKRLNKVRGQVKEKEHHVPKIPSCNPEVPFASDAVAVKYDDIFGRHLVATRDIKPGETLVVEKPYALILAPEHMYTHCAKCLDVAWDSIPCDHCVYAMFCSEKCKEEAWKEFHDIECPVVGLLLNLEMNILGLLSMRLAVVTVRRMESFEALRKEFQIVDNWKDPRTRGYADDGKFHSEDYRSVYSLTTNADKRSVPDLFGRALNTTYILYFLATETEMFGTKLKANLPSLAKNSDLTFVGGMILRHQQMIPSNVHMFVEERDFDNVERGAALMPFFSLINHSCDHNITRQSLKEHMVLYALYPIEKGEQLFDNYGLLYAVMEKASRRKKLKEQFFFDCNCLPCEEDWPTYFHLPSYSHWISSPQERAKIEKALRNFNRYMELATEGDIETEPNMLKNMFKMIEFLFENVPLPFVEINNIIETIKRVESLHGNTFLMPKI